MKSALIMLNSYTETVRAAKYLGSLKIRAVTEKSTSGGGCSFGIRVDESPEKVCRLLSAVNIRCGRIIVKE